MAALCRRCGFAVGEQAGNTVTLHVRSPFGVRPVTLVCESNVTGIAVFSAFDQPAHRVRPELLGHLLTRSGQLAVGGWLLCEHDSGNACFGLRYTAPTAGLSAGYLKFALDTLLAEVGDYDARLRQAGLL